MGNRNFPPAVPLTIIILSFLLLWQGCAVFVKAPHEPELRKLSEGEVRLRQWIDDMFYESLDKAVDQSIRYYSELPPDRIFEYNQYAYTPEQMIKSMQLFKNILKRAPKQEIARELRQKFHFFESKNADGHAFFTGYYEPEIRGSIQPTDKYSEPLYETPDDLVEVRLGDFSKEWDGITIVGKLNGRRMIPYDSREEIVYGRSLSGRAKAIAYVKEIELFFLQIQGSGVVRLEDNRKIRVNYAHKNGHPYRPISQVLMDKINPEEMSLQAIKEYLYGHPDEVRQILNYNQSYTFFRITDDGPLGNINVPLTPYRSVAMDKMSVPNGGLAYIETELPVFNDSQLVGWKPIGRFVLVQDTGGAIREHGRVDLFVGSGRDAELIAGHMKRAGRAFLLVAKKEFLK